MKSKNDPGRRPDPCPPLPDESSRNYAAFCAYRDLPPSSRSLEALRRQFGDGSARRSLRWLEELSSRFSWCERARSHDEYMERIRQKGREAAAVAQAKLWEERRLRALEECWDDALALRKLARRMMAMPIAEAASKDGKTVVKPGKWTFATAGLLALKASEIQVAIFNSVDRHRPVEEMSIEELRAIEEVEPAMPGESAVDGGPGRPRGIRTDRD